MVELEEVEEFISRWFAEARNIPRWNRAGEAGEEIWPGCLGGVDPEMRSPLPSTRNPWSLVELRDDL